MRLHGQSEADARPMLPPRWRRHPVLSSLLFGLLALAILDRAGRLFRPQDDYNRYHDKMFRVVNIVDAGTFDIDARDGRRPHTRVRLCGIHPPNAAGPTHGGPDYRPEASAFARQALLDRQVRLELPPSCSRDDGRDDRLLAYVYVVGSDEMFNESLLNAGHARADRRVDHPWSQRFRELEQKSIRRQVGLWRTAHSSPLPPRKTEKESPTDPPSVDRSPSARLE